MRKNKLILACAFSIVLFLFITSCSLKDKTFNKIDDKTLRLYMSLQEELIDTEEEQRDIIKSNTELEKEINYLHTQVQDLVKEIESKNNEEEFIEETHERFTEELPSPKDRIQEEQIRITKERVVLNIKKVGWGYMLDTNSMDPLLDKGTNILTIKPDSEEDIDIGDIIVFKANFSRYDIAHRVINISKDEKGLYYTTKGDNNPKEDPVRIRFDDVVMVVIGILY